MVTGDKPVGRKEHHDLPSRSAVHSEVLPDFTFLPRRILRDSRWVPGSRGSSIKGFCSSCRDSSEIRILDLGVLQCRPSPDSSRRSLGVKYLLLRPHVSPYTE